MWGQRPRLSIERSSTFFVATASKIEPPPVFAGDVYQAADLPHVPATLRDALALFEASDFVRESFGEDVQEHYVHFFHDEQNAYDRAVTDWERWRYFERI